MSDFMNDVITQVNPNHKNEQINWTKIQRCQTGETRKIWGPYQLFINLIFLKIKLAMNQLLQL
jgi:hypothetical protein